MKLTSVSELKRLLDEYGIAPSRQRGQNFLVDENALNKIVLAANVKERNCLEIGPGAGTLTQRLAKESKRVVAIELDSGLCRMLERTLAGFDNVTVIHADVIKADLGAICEEAFSGEEFVAAANLPYYITAAVVTRLVELKKLTAITVLVQKEVAERMAAKPGSRDYGSLSVALQYSFEAKIMGSVTPGCFYPAPKVDSSILRMDRLSTPRVSVRDESFFFRLVRAAFGQRRKTLLNNLMALGLKKEDTERIIRKCGIEPNRRAETLSLQEFARLADEFVKQ